MSNGPLSELRVLELGHFVAAPFCTRLLADLGAEVIKVEPPGRGDPIRTWGEQVDGNSPWWSVHGRNKHCITLNLKHERGRDLALRLVSQVDVVVENFRPGQMERWGLGVDALAEARPGCVLVRISGYGQTGPGRDQASFGVIGEAKGGLRYLCGHPKEISDLPPVRTGVSLGDSVAGLYGALGALAAVMEQRRSRTREVKVVDVALNEAVFSLLEGCLPEFSVLGRVRQPTGSTLATNAPSNAYRCSDGAWLIIAANSNPLFRTLAALMGQPELADDPRFLDNQSRLANARALDEIIGQWTATRTVAQGLGLLEPANIPATRIYTIADCADDPQYKAREMLVSVEDPRLGELLHPGAVPLMAGVDRKEAIRWPGPPLGAHNPEVYGGLLGLSDEELSALREGGLI